MFDRPLHLSPFRPRNLKLPTHRPSHLEEVSHVPGEAAAIRFFDPYSDSDLNAMREILKGRKVKYFMDHAWALSKSEYRDWAGRTKDDSFLFAALDTRAQTPKEFEYVRGFVYIYSEREEKFRVRRMEKQGFLPPTRRKRHALEISFAVRPLKYGVQAGSGVMSSAVRQACLQVQLLLSQLERPEIILFGFVDQENVHAQRTLEASGFVKQGLMKYDSDSETEACLYFLNWRFLYKKLREKALASQTLDAKP